MPAAAEQSRQEAQNLFPTQQLLHGHGTAWYYIVLHGIQEY